MLSFALLLLSSPKITNPTTRPVVGPSYLFFTNTAAAAAAAKAAAAEATPAGGAHGGGASHPQGPSSFMVRTPVAFVQPPPPSPTYVTGPQPMVSAGYATSQPAGGAMNGLRAGGGGGGGAASYPQHPGTMTFDQSRAAAVSLAPAAPARTGGGGSGSGGGKGGKRRRTDLVPSGSVVQGGTVQMAFEGGCYGSVQVRPKGGPQPWGCGAARGCVQPSLEKGRGGGVKVARTLVRCPALHEEGATKRVLRAKIPPCLDVDLLCLFTSSVGAGR